MFTCLHLSNSRHLPLSSDSHCYTWTATSVWTCRLRRTRWCPPWETATTAALSSGCSVTWPWASDPSPSPLPPHHSHRNQSWHSTPSPGGSYQTRHTPLPVSAWPANAEIPGSSSGLSSITEVSPFTGLREAGPAMTSCGFGDLVMSRQGERCVCDLCLWRTLKSKHCPVSQLLALHPLCCSDCCLAAGQTNRRTSTTRILQGTSPQWPAL